MLGALGGVLSSLAAIVLLAFSAREPPSPQGFGRTVGLSAIAVCGILLSLVLSRLDSRTKYQTFSLSLPFEGGTRRGLKQAIASAVSEQGLGVANEAGHLLSRERDGWCLVLPNSVRIKLIPDYYRELYQILVRSDRGAADPEILRVLQAVERAIKSR